MPSHIQPTDHYILGKLGDQVLPPMIGGRRAGKQWFVWVATLYQYGGELATAVAGLGIGGPLLPYLQGKTSDGVGFVGAIGQIIGQSPVSVLLGTVALSIWVVMRVIVRQQNVLDRAPFARDCSRTSQKLYDELFATLADSNPIDKIIEIQQAAIQMVREARSKNVWPWDGLPLERDLEPELEREIAYIRSTFMSRWAPPPPGVG